MSSHFPISLLTLDGNRLIASVLGVELHLNVVLICSSLIIGEVEYLLTLFHISSSANSRFMSFVHFFPVDF